MTVAYQAPLSVICGQYLEWIAREKAKEGEDKKYVAQVAILDRVSEKTSPRRECWKKCESELKISGGRNIPAREWIIPYKCPRNGASLDYSDKSKETKVVGNNVDHTFYLVAAECWKGIEYNSNNE